MDSHWAGRFSWKAWQDGKYQYLGGGKRAADPQAGNVQQTEEGGQHRRFKLGFKLNFFNRSILELPRLPPPRVAVTSLEMSKCTEREINEQPFDSNTEFKHYIILRKSQISLGWRGSSEILDFVPSIYCVKIRWSKHCLNMSTSSREGQPFSQKYLFHSRF